MNASRTSTEKSMQASPNDWFPAFAPSAEILKSATPSGVQQPGYYGIPLLKRPTWHWHIAWYFYLEGISAGSLLIANLANLFGDTKLRPITRAGRLISFFSFLPCPPLLIADLGDPSRFHHMLRVFKPSSPMNLGTWVLTGYSLPLTLLSAKQISENLPKTYAGLKSAGQWIPARTLEIIGLPLSLEMAGYSGVLLSQTSTPLWTTSRWLGPLMAVSAIHNGIAATSLSVAMGNDRGRFSSLRRLAKVQRITRIAETIALSLYLITTGRKAKPLLTGKHGRQFWLGAVCAGLLIPTLLDTLRPRRRRPSPGRTILSAALSLAGGFALKWALVQAGKTSADQAAQSSARP